MTVEGLVIWLVIGAIAGWLAGLIMKGYGFGLACNILVGIVGAFIAGWLLPRIGFVFIGGIGAVSVFKAAYVDKRALKCACVSGDSQAPLGFVALIENLAMVAMAVWMLAAPMA